MELWAERFDHETRDIGPATVSFRVGAVAMQRADTKALRFAYIFEVYRSNYSQRRILELATCGRLQTTEQFLILTFASSSVLSLCFAQWRLA